MNAKALTCLLKAIDGHLKSPGSICLIGSGATILLGYDGRQTDDIDVWMQSSAIRVTELKQACEAAGLTFDPKDEFPALPYIQLIHPGLVQVPGWSAERREWFGEAERVVWQGAYLTVTVPPPSAIAASKLIRGEPQDLEDCLWLMAAHPVDLEALRAAIDALPLSSREKAEDNRSLLGMLKP